MTFLRRLWHLLNRRRYEHELVQEMQEHRELMHDPKKFGDTHRLLERSRDAWGWNWLDDATQDLKIGVRTLVKSPSFATTATLILTFGIGLNVTLYQMVQVTLFRPPAIESPESWARFLYAERRGSSTAVPYPVAKFVETHNSVLEAVLIEAGSSIAWGRNAEQEVEASFVSSNWFDELGYGPLHGRLFHDAFDATADIPSVVVGFNFWRSQLGADPAVIGTTTYLDRKPVTIVGVAPSALPGLDFDAPDVFIPIVQRAYLYPESEFLQAWGTPTVAMYGRFKDGVAPAAGREALRSVMTAISAERPEVAAGMWLEPLMATSSFMRPRERADILTTVALIAGLTGLVMLVAAANLGNLVMSRATGRVREFGVRMALGARRTRIMRQLVAEAVPLVVLGALGSLAFAAAAATLIASLTDFPSYLDFGIEWRTVVSAIMLGGVALTVIGLIPAWKVAQQHLIEAIKDGGQHVSRMLDRALLRRIMVGAQVAGSCVLLIVAGMMVRSVQRVVTSNPGFDYESAAVLSMRLDRYGLAGEAARVYWYSVKERALGNPEVEKAAIVTAPPLGGRTFETIYDDIPHLSIFTQAVDPEYFETMRIPLIAGRLFQSGEAGTAIISRRLALEMYGTMEVLGLGFPKHEPRAVVIGVAADAHAIRVNATNAAEHYLPLTVADFSEVFLVARARTAAERLPPILRDAGSLDRRVIPAARTMREDFDRRMQGPRLAGIIASGIGGLTLTLACLGIFGVVSYGVALRTKEIGIRVALGARQPALLRSIVRQVLTPIAVGVVVGSSAALTAGRALSGQPFYLRHADPVAIAGALVIFLAAGTIAALWPAWLVLRSNPVDALRHQ